MTSPTYRANYAQIDWSKTPKLPRGQTSVVQRSTFPCPRIASDHLDSVQSMVTGKVYDSKSALRAEYRRHGVEEVGNDPARLRPRKKPPIDDKQIVRAIDKAEARFNRGERVLKKA